MASMLVVGSVAVDTIHNPSGTHPRVLGGSAVYATLAGSVFAPQRLVGVVGSDYPEEATQMLQRRGIDLAGLETVEGETFHWEGVYSDDLASRESLKTELNVFADFDPKIPETFRDSPYVMLGNIDPVLQVRVLEQIHQPKLVIADTMNFWIDGKPKELAAMLKRIDLLVINEEEARQLAGIHNLVRVAAALRRMGPTNVVIKCGEYGALLFGEDGVFSAPAYPVEEVLDPTGAGDTFAGGLLGYIAQQDNTDPGTLRRAVIYGSALASYCVEGISVNRLIEVDRPKVEARFEAFAKLASF
jgi:sugar/nucleoside kinase (ribokinase family)